MKKLLGLVLVLAMLCSTMPAFAITGAGELPIVTEPVTLKVAIAEDARLTGYEENDFTTYVETETGIDLEFVILPATDTAAKVKLMFASDDLPDLYMNGSIDKPTLYDYGDEGMVIPLNDYIDQYGLNFQNVLATCANPFMEALCTAPDGNIYFMPLIVEEYHGIYSERSWIYQPWLDAVSMEMPTTTEEYVEVLKAFRDKDPNGNGVQDEIPMVCHSGDLKYLVRFFMNSFVYWDGYDNMIVNEDGTVTPAFFEPEFKEGLEWLNMLIDEKLMDPASFTQDSSTLIAQLNAETVNIGHVPTAWMDGGWIDTGSERRMNYAFMGPLSGPEGVKYSVKQTPNPSIGGYITYKCENPDVAFRLFDFMLDPYVSMLNRYGVEGRDWTYIDTGDVALDGTTATWKDINEIWQLTTTNAYWRRKGPHYHPIGTFEKLSAVDEKMAYNSLLVRTAGELEGLQPEVSVPTAWAMTADEMATYNDLRPSIDTYLWENISKFIIGDRDFAEWDSFIAEFDNMNMDGYLAVINSCYARMSGN